MGGGVCLAGAHEKDVTSKEEMAAILEQVHPVAPHEAGVGHTLRCGLGARCCLPGLILHSAHGRSAAGGRSSCHNAIQLDDLSVDQVSGLFHACCQRPCQAKHKGLPPGKSGAPSSLFIIPRADFASVGLEISRS